MLYLDHAATTPVRPEVLEAMAPFFTSRFGNPSSHHTVGEAAADALADARRRVGTVERAVLEYGDNLTLGSFHHARLDDTCGLTAPCLLDVAIIGVDDSGLVHARREVHGSLED